MVRKMMVSGSLPPAPSKAEDMDSRAVYLSFVHGVEVLEDEGYDSEVHKQRLDHAGTDSEAPEASGTPKDGRIWQDGPWRGKCLDKEAMQRHAAVPCKGNTPGDATGALHGRAREMCQKKSQGRGASGPPIGAASDGRKDGEAPSSEECYR